MDLERMLEDINKLVRTDFAMWMEAKLLKGNYTQKEAREMANLIGKVYLISHCTSCTTCGKKYTLSEYQDPSKLWHATLPSNE